MNKLRVKPIYNIDGTDFVVDIDKQVLREAQRPANEISFLTDMIDKVSHYELCFDTKRNVPHKKGEYDYFLSENWVKIPMLVELDPEGMAAKYNLTGEQLQGKNDFEVIVDQEALAQRRQGILPQIDLAGEKFTIDLRLQELRNSRYFFPVISLKSFELTNDGWHFEAYYHQVMKQVVALDPKLLEFPEGVIKLKIPNEIGLDPVATARKYGTDERELLRHYPIQKNLKAEVIPLSETHIPALIRRNKDTLREEHRLNVQRIKPRQRPKF